MRMRKPRGYAGLPAVFVVVILAATGVLSQNPPSAPKQVQSGDPGCRDQQGASPAAKKIKYPTKERMNWYPIQKEIALGEGQSRQFERGVKLIEDRAVLDYIDAIVQKLACSSVTRLPLTIKVVASSQPNILTFPGGFVYLTSEAIRQSANEDELAAVIAHGMGHVNARHATVNITRANLANLMSIPLIYTGDPVCDGGGCGAGLVGPLIFPKFHRAFEFEADSLAVQYLANAGYDPAAYVSWLGKLGSVGDPKLEKFSPFPPPQERIRRVEKEIAEMSLTRGDSIRNSPGLEEIKKRLPLIEIKPPEGNGSQKPELIRHIAEQ